MQKKKIAIICGGPSAERGISLNSARSIYDNLDKEKYDIKLIYFNPFLDAFLITPTQIYSNTPLDFDYKLSHEGGALTKDKLSKELKSVDTVIPVIHGFFGEDGQLQSILEDFNVKYVGSGPEACRNTSDKSLCQKILADNNFYTIESWKITKGQPLPNLKEGKYVVKPLHGGSSLGVQYFEFPVRDQENMNKKLEQVFSHEKEALIEPFFEGIEFTIIILENDEGVPVALYPTEIEFNNKSDSFFNYRKKYLATDDIRYHTPARFSEADTQNIRKEAEKAYTALGMKDFGRIDGWLTEDGTIWFSDVNAISGMEQNSFLFQQAALFGISHRQLLDYIINKKIDAPSVNTDREEIPVIFGGNTAEKQVSVMSGTNVWMKLKSSSKYKPIPLFLSLQDKIFHIPQFLCLHHTVEEIEEKVEKFQSKGFFESLQKKQHEVLKKLKVDPKNLEEQIFIPYELTLKEISKKYNFLFLGLHGGEGENGIFQAKLEKLNLPYNGPGSESSSLCMDKFQTGQKIIDANIEGIKTAKKKIIQLDNNPETIWSSITKEGFHIPLILKPVGDGCSAGVIRINDKEHFIKAIEFFNSDQSFIPEKAIHDSHGQIELPREPMTEVLVEEFIETDKVILEDLEINWKPKTDIIEITVGVLGDPGNITSFFPSQTIASQEILSLEEKFMGGTGINLTPPPSAFVKPEIISKVQNLIKKVAEILRIEGYSRIDTFMNIKTGEITVIEANTLPGLTPSTVIFHQALAEPNPMTPLYLIEKIIEIGKNRFQNKYKDDRKPARIQKTPKIESLEKSRI